MPMAVVRFLLFPTFKASISTNLTFFRKNYIYMVDYLYDDMKVDEPAMDLACAVG